MNMLSAKVKSGVATSSSRLQRDARFDLKVQNAASVARRAPSPVRSCESESFFFFRGGVEKSERATGGSRVEPDEGCYSSPTRLVCRGDDTGR